MAIALLGAGRISLDHLLGGRGRTAKKLYATLADRVFDLRVEDHPSPLEELRRLTIIPTS